MEAVGLVFHPPPGAHQLHPLDADYTETGVANNLKLAENTNSLFRCLLKTMKHLTNVK